MFTSGTSGSVTCLILPWYVQSPPLSTLTSENVRGFAPVHLSNPTAQYLFIFTVLDPIIVIPMKAAILLEWMRIFIPRSVRNRYFWVAWFLIGFNTIFYIIAGFLVIYAVQPVPRNYNVLLPGTTPFNRMDIEILATVVNLFIDVGIFLLPQPIIWGLMLSKGRKIGLALMFSLGLLFVFHPLPRRPQTPDALTKVFAPARSIACAAGRLHAQIHMEYPWPVIGDTSWFVSPLWLWWMAEMTSIHILLVAPSLPRAFAGQGILGRFITSLRSWTRTSSKSSKSREGGFKSWPRTIGSGGKAGRAQRLEDEDGTVMGLSDLKYMQDSTRSDARSANLSQSNMIRKTVEVEQDEETASKISLDPVQKRQHPWSGGV